MGAKPFIAARISEDLNQKLEEHSKITGESKTQALVNALTNYLGISVDRKEGVDDRLKILEQKIVALEDFTKEIKGDFDNFKTSRKSIQKNSKAPKQLTIVDNFESYNRLNTETKNELEKVDKIPENANKLESKELLKLLRKEDEKENWKEKLAGYRATKARVGFWHKVGNIKFTYAESEKGSSLHRRHYWWVVVVQEPFPDELEEF